MTRALFWLALVAVVGCFAGVQAGPSAQELQKSLNGVHQSLLDTPVSQELDDLDARAEQLMVDALDAHSKGETTWASDAFPGGISLAEQDSENELDMDLDLDMDLESKPTAGFAKGLDQLVKKGLLSSTVAKKITGLQSSSSAKAVKGKGKGSYDKGGKATAVHSSFLGSSNAEATTDITSARVKKLKSIQAVTGSKGTKNSQCFACQYFLQRTLGALLGPFYAPHGAAPPTAVLSPPPPSTAVTGTPRTEYLRESITSGIHTALGKPVPSEPRSQSVILSETDSHAAAFIELSSIVKEGFYVPTAEEATSQYNKWKAFLPEFMVASEQDAAPALIETQAEVEIEAEVDFARGSRGGRSQKKSKENKDHSLDTGYGSMFNHDQLFAARAFFSSLCHRRVPAEWQPTCRALWGKLNVIIEELASGDRPDEICLRHKICDASSYLAKQPHSAVRQVDSANKGE